VIAIEEIDRAVAFLRDSADEAAKCRAERLYLDDFSKSLKAEIMGEHLTETLGAQERIAYADVRYRSRLQALQLAIHKDEKLRFLRGAAEVKIEVWRSQISWAKTQEKV
jgi:hypothetical protein